MPSESIILYHESDFITPIIAPRDEVYSQRGEKYGEYYISYVDALIFTPTGELIVQRRAKNKKVSPNLLHTTVGGHVNPDEDIVFTITHECMEEFGSPCFIVPDSMGFAQVYEKLRPYNDRMVIMKLLRKWQLEFTHEDENGTFVSRDVCHDFVGVFSGEPKNLDDSVSEFVSFSLEELDDRIADMSHDFTKSFQAHYDGLRRELYAFRQELIG
jgi:isopentenyldiphosphate isomerase